MRNFISEDDIEKAILSKLKEAPFEYDIITCDADPNKRDDLNDGTGRSLKRECVLPCVLEESLKSINPDFDEQYIKNIVKDLRRDFTGTDMVATNYKLYNQIRNGIKITVRRNGKEDFDFVKLIDFNEPTNNIFTAVSQMWIQGKAYYRRPDVIVFVNGLPLVFIELKNSIVKVEEAYNKNLQDYKKDIPNLFAFNQICVLSNGLETRLGAFNATYDYFFEWLKVNSEKEGIDRDEIRNSTDANKAACTEGDKSRYLDEVEKIFTKVKVLREQLEVLEASVQSTEANNYEKNRISQLLQNHGFEITEYDDMLVRRLIECIKIMSNKTIVVIFKGGFEVTESLQE